MKNIIIKILNWIRDIFFVKDILPPAPQPIPTPELVPVPTPTVIPTPIVPIVPKVNKLDLWIQAIKDMEGAKPYRNNPGNLRYVGQKNAVDDNGFCKFDTYQNGYDALKNHLIDACTGKSRFYWPDMSLLKFESVYAPSSDGNNPAAYAKFVAGRLGVTTSTMIKDIIA